MAADYENMHFRIHSWMKVNPVRDYEVLLGNDRIELSVCRLGFYVANVFSSLQELARMSEDIADIAVYMPRTGKMVSLLDCCESTLPKDAVERIDQADAPSGQFIADDYLVMQAAPPTELERMSRLDSETMEAAQIFVSMLPVLPSHPFFQQYFTKGLVLGGVKG